MTQGDGNLNVTNKQEYLFNTGSHTIVGKVVDTPPPTQNSKEECTENYSYSDSFESLDSEGELSQEKLKKENIVISSGHDGDLKLRRENNQTDHTDKTVSHIKQEVTPSTSTPRQDNPEKDKLDNSTGDTYSETFCSDSKTKTKSSDKSKFKRITDDEDDDATLTETSWPSYCQDQGEEQGRDRYVFCRAQYVGYLRYFCLKFNYWYRNRI